MFKSRLCTLISILTLFTLLTACGQDIEVARNDSLNNIKTEAAISKISSPVSFSFYINFGWWLETGWGKDLTTKEITRLTGVNLKIARPANGNEEIFGLNTMLASGVFPDMIMMDNSVISKKLIQEKIFVPLNNLIEQYGSDIKKNVGLDYLKEYCTENDGTIFGLPNGVTFDGQPVSSGNGIIMLKRLYERLGSPPLNTLEDLYQYLLKVRDSGLKTQNNENIIPAYFDWPCLNLAASYGLKFFSTYGGSYVYRTDGKLEQILRNTKMKEIFQFSNKLFREKLTDPNWLLQDPETEFKNVTSGRYAMYFSSNAYTWLDQYNDRVKKDSGDSYVLIKTPLAPGVSNPKYNLISKKPWTMIYITSSCKDPVRAVEFLNWMASEKGQYVSRIGPEGVVWNSDSKGDPIITPEYEKKMLMDKGQTLNEIGHMKWCFQQNNKFLSKAINALLNPEERLERDKRSKIITSSTWSAPELEKISLDAVSQVGITNTKLNTYFTKMDKQLYLAKDETAFEKYYNEIYAEMKRSGLNDIEDELNKQINENRK